MLLHMHIKNIALIDDLNIDFGDGLNILTGETGAGKSIIIGSLGIGLGGKFQKDLLRDADRDGLVELLFQIEDDSMTDKLKELDIDAEDGEILIQRRLSSNGRTVNKINDSTVTTAKLKLLAAILIDLHAQHEHVDLLKASKHLMILDKFGGSEIEKAKSKVSLIYNEYKDICDKLDKDCMDESEKNKKIDFLEYQIKEIEQADLKPGEDEELESAFKKIENSKEILSLAGEVYSMTAGGDSYQSTCESAIDLVGMAIMKMSKIAGLDDTINSYVESLVDVEGILGDFNKELALYMTEMEFDEEAYEKVSNRLDLINGLKAKYGNSIEAVLDSLEEFGREYDKLCAYEDYIAKLKADCERVKNELSMASDELTDIRKEYSAKLCGIIKESLVELNFENVVFDMEFEKKDTFSNNGNDNAYFTISTNVGEPTKPLYCVASGGELSRVMLAIKSCLANEDDTPTLVFDEIDVGISGRTAQKVAEKMSIIAKSHQVICITHLAQIAAMADSHYSIEKNVINNKTITDIRLLDKEEEISELARILGGAKITDSTIASAKEMKELAKKSKK